MARKPGTRAEFTLFDVFYEDGSQRSNRRVPSEILGGLDGDAPARAVIEEQDRIIAEKSGSPALPIKSIRRSGAMSRGVLRQVKLGRMNQAVRTGNLMHCNSVQMADFSKGNETSSTVIPEPEPHAGEAPQQRHMAHLAEFGMVAECSLQAVIGNAAAQ